MRKAASCPNLVRLARAGLALLALWLGAWLPAAAEEAASAPPADSYMDSVRELALAGAAPAAQGLRVEVEVGSLDPRLKLAPCTRVEPHLPPGTRLWGRARIGLRCVEGPVRWNVYLPVTVKVFGHTLVTAGALNAGSVIGPQDLIEAEVDLAAQPGRPIADATLLVGRTLSRSLAAGQPVRDNALKPRVWFGAGDSVRVIAVGRGWRIASQAQALGPGLEGQSVRVRTDSGRVITGQAVGERMVEIPL